MSEFAPRIEDEAFDFPVWNDDQREIRTKDAHVIWPGFPLINATIHFHLLGLIFCAITDTPLWAVPIFAVSILVPYGLSLTRDARQRTREIEQNYTVRFDRPSRTAVVLMNGQEQNRFPLDDGTKIVLKTYSALNRPTPGGHAQYYDFDWYREILLVRGAKRVRIVSTNPNIAIKPDDDPFLALAQELSEWLTLPLWFQDAKGNYGPRVDHRPQHLIVP